MEIIEENHDFELSSRVWRTTNERQFSHWHKNVEILHVLENGCRILVGGNVYEANEGDIIVIKEQITHRNFFKEEPLNFRVIHFNNKIMINHNMLPGEIQEHIKAEEIRKIPHLEESLKSIFTMTDREGRTTDAKANLFFQSLVMSVYFLLLRHFPAREKENVNAGEVEDFYKIVDYINDNYKEDISIQSIAGALFLSRSRITRLFMKYSGMRIGEYVTDLRIKKANQALLTGHTVTEAALESGFQSVRTFNSVYKSHMGITPTEYQKSIK